MNSILNTLGHIGDIFATPMFGIGIYYFYNIKNKTLIEIILFLFCIIGFGADLIFSINYLYYVI